MNKKLLLLLLMVLVVCSLVGTPATDAYLPNVFGVDPPDGATNVPLTPSITARINERDVFDSGFYLITDASAPHIYLKVKQVDQDCNQLWCVNTYHLQLYNGSLNPGTTYKLILYYRHGSDKAQIASFTTVGAPATQQSR